MHFFDQALEDFQARAGSRRPARRHAARRLRRSRCGISARAPRSPAPIGIGTDAAAWELNDRVPLLLKVPGQARARPTGAVPVAAGQTDFAPTLLALLGIDPADLPYAGRNLLGNPGDLPLPRPYGDWLDRTHLFMSGSSSDRGGACFALSQRRVRERLGVPGDERHRPTRARDQPARRRRRPAAAVARARYSRMRPRMNRVVVLLAAVAICVAAGRPAGAQDAPPPIGPFVVDLHGVVPRFGDDPELAESRGLTQAELPGSGLGISAGAHVYLAEIPRDHDRRRRRS